MGQERPTLSQPSVVVVPFVAVLEPDDVLLLQVAAGLHLGYLRRDRSRVLRAMLSAYRNVCELIFR